MCSLCIWTLVAFPRVAALTLMNVSCGYFFGTWATCQTREADAEKPLEKEKIGWVLEAFRSPMQWFVPIALECKHNMTGFQFLAMPEGQAVPLLGRTILNACYVNARLLATRLLPPGWMETGQEESKTGPLSVGKIMARFFNLSFFQIPRSKIFSIYIYLFIHIYVFLKGIKDRYVLVCKRVLYETFFVEKAAGW